MVIRPKVEKTVVKGTILILAFSLFLDFYKVLAFLEFLGISFALLLLYTAWKRAITYEFGDDGIKISSPFRKKVIPYSSIDDAFVSAGFLARRFRCGSIYIVTKDRRVELIRDIPNPQEAFEILRRKVK